MGDFWIRSSFMLLVVIFFELESAIIFFLIISFIFSSLVLARPSLLFYFLLFLLYLFLIWLTGSNNQFWNYEFEFHDFFWPKRTSLLCSLVKFFFIKNNLIGYKIHDSYFQSCLLDDLVSRIFIYFCIGIFVYVLVFWHFCRPRSTRTQWPFRFAFRQNTGGWTYLPMWFVRIFA